MTGRSRQHDLVADHRRVALGKLGVPGADERASRLLDQTIGLATNEVSRDSKRNRPGAVVRRDRHREGVGQRGHLRSLGQPASPPDVECRHVDRTRLEQRQKPAPTSASLAGRDRHPDLRPQRTQGSDSVRPQRILDPVRPELRQRPRDLRRRGPGPQTMQLDHQIHLEPDLSPDRRNDLQPGGQLPRRDVRAVARLRRLVERPDLHPPDALVPQLPSEPSRVVHERVQVLVPAVLGHTPVRRVLSRRRADVPHARAGVVRRVPVPDRPAERPRQRKTGGLPHQIPQRDVDRAVTPLLGPAALITDVRREQRRHLLRRRIVQPQQDGRNRLVDIRLDSPSTVERFAQTGQPGVSVQPDKAQVRLNPWADGLEPRSPSQLRLPSI